MHLSFAHAHELLNIWVFLIFGSFFATEWALSSSRLLRLIGALCAVIGGLVFVLVLLTPHEPMVTNAPSGTPIDIGIAHIGLPGVPFIHQFDLLTFIALQGAAIVIAFVLGRIAPLRIFASG